MEAGRAGEDGSEIARSGRAATARRFGWMAAVAAGAFVLTVVVMILIATALDRG